MEAEPIIPAMSPSRQPFSGGIQHRPYFSGGEEEEFPGDEGNPTLYNRLNGSGGYADANKATLNSVEPQKGARTSYGSKTEGYLTRNSSANTSTGSRRQDSLNPAESIGDETPIGLQLLSEHKTGDSPNRATAADDMNYIDIKSFQKSNAKKKGGHGNNIPRSNQKTNKKAPDLSAYNLPENTIRNNRSSVANNSNSNLEERRQLEMEKEAFENSKAKHNNAMKVSMVDVDETIDTTQSSEQKFLSLEDVKGIFQDVKESTRILNCVGDEALHGVDDEVGGGGMYEETALLGRITSGIRDSLQMLSPTAVTNNSKTGEIPTEIAIPMREGDGNGTQPATIDTQISELEKLEDEGIDHHHQQQQRRAAPLLQQYQQEDQPPAKGLQVVAPTPERAPIPGQQPALQQMSPLERKVSKVIMKQMQDEEERLQQQRSSLHALRMVSKAPENVLQGNKEQAIRNQMQDEEARLHQERSSLHSLRTVSKAPENVLRGISFLRNKEQTRIQLEAAAEAKAKKDMQHAREVNKINKALEDEYGEDHNDYDDDYVEENDSQGAFGTLRKVLTHMYHNSNDNNEITLEEYEKQVRANEPPPPPPMEDDDEDRVVHEKSKGKKKMGTSIFKSILSSKSKTKKPPKSSSECEVKKKKKSGFFSKRFKNHKSSKGDDEGGVYSA